MRLNIGRRPVGDGRPCYVIAEIGSNHDGRLAQAQRLIAVAAKSGADAVKFQSIKYEGIFVPGLESAKHRAFFEKLELPESWYAALKRTADDEGVHFLSCPTYDESVALLRRTGVPAYKIASPQTRANLPLVRLTARQGLPMIVSTGYCAYDDIAAAVRACEAEGNRKLVLLHCVSEYPTKPARLNLGVMGTLRRKFGYPVGLSDHTLGATAAVAAVALGACVLEKHLTLDRGLPGPDHAFATEPGEFRDMVAAMREAEAMLGDGVKKVSRRERESAKSLQLRLIASRPISVGARLRRADFILRRASFGLTPDDGGRVFGRAARRAISPSRPLVRADVGAA